MRKSTICFRSSFAWKRIIAWKIERERCRDAREYDDGGEDHPNGAFADDQAGGE